MPFLSLEGRDTSPLLFFYQQTTGKAKRSRYKSNVKAAERLSTNKKLHTSPKEKGVKHNRLTPSFPPVGVTGFEPATTRPPDAYSNRAELHPELRMQKYRIADAKVVLYFKIANNSDSFFSNRMYLPRLTWLSAIPIVHTCNKLFHIPATCSYLPCSQILSIFAARKKKGITKS